MADKIVSLPPSGHTDAAEVKRLHHLAGDELIEHAVSMLAFMEFCGEHEDGDDFQKNGAFKRDRFVSRRVRARCREIALRRAKAMRREAL